jgi:hypothetical protein
MPRSCFRKCLPCAWLLISIYFKRVFRSILLSADAGNDFWNGYAGETGLTASSASHAERFFVSFYKSSVFVVVPIFESRRTLRSEIMSPSYFGKINDIAGI